ncbi:MAG: GGDEF domain-containing protein [Syntrophomonadaceae bacterium]
MSNIIHLQTLALIFIVSSFTIFVFTRSLNREPSFTTLQASLFITSLVAGLILSYSTKLPATVILGSAQALMALIWMALLNWPPGESDLGNWEKCITIIGLAPLLLLARPEVFRTYELSNIIPPFLGAGLFLIVLLMQRKKHPLPQPHLYTSLVFFIMAPLALLRPDSWIKTASILLYGGAFIYFFAYFYRQSMDLLRSKIAEAESKLLEWERAVRKEVNKRTFEVERSNTRLLDMTKIDPMTECLNKVNIIKIINDLAEDRQQKPFSVLMFDIDNFKTINDTRGHLTGDMIIKQVAATARGCVRDRDSVGRYGGDEFIITLPTANLTDAHTIAERLRKRIAENELIDCTVSIGLASFPVDGNNAQELIKAADEGLYISKQKGRNAVSHLSNSLP